MALGIINDRDTGAAIRSKLNVLLAAADSNTIINDHWVHTEKSLGECVPGTIAPISQDCGNGLFFPAYGLNAASHAGFVVGHDYDITSAGHLYVECFVAAAMTLGDTFTWQLTFVKARSHKQGESLTAATSSVSLQYVADGTEVAGELIMVEMSDAQAIDLLEPDTVLAVKVTATVLPASGALYGVNVGLHYRVGQIGTLNKSPDYFA